MKKIITILLCLIISMFLYGEIENIKITTDGEKIGNKTTEAEIKNIEEKEVVFYQTGTASFYGGRWNGRKTASGEIFNSKKMTAAHKSLPFGSIVKVTNLSNGKTVIVKINDRGPFIKGRIIDLSQSAFAVIEKEIKGLTKVKLEIIK